MTIRVVTGTGTGVGKTVVTAALATTSPGSVVVGNPVQTGIHPGSDPADVDEIRRLAGCDVVELTRLEDPLAPDTAARLRDVEIPAVSSYADPIRDLATAYDTVLVEGAGGLLVRLDTEGGTLLDLAVDLGAEVVVVVAAGLGTLNHSELTVGALRARGLEPSGLVIGAWPERPDLAERCNRDDLPLVTGVPLLGVVPAGAGSLSRSAFQEAAPTWIG